MVDAIKLAEGGNERVSALYLLPDFLISHADFSTASA